VFIREELCTGCGACAKGCPWDNIRMAPRSARLEGTALSTPGQVAVKCDLCRDREGGPACVAVCPAQAIARVSPGDVLVDVRDALGGEGRKRAHAARVMPRPVPAWPFALGATIIAASVVVVPRPPDPASRTTALTTGLLAGVLFLWLLAYAVVKRLRRARWIAQLFSSTRPAARWAYIAHLALGALAVGAVFTHAGLRAPPNAAGALAVAFWGLAISGALGAIAYGFLPARLSRIERGGALPEDLARKGVELDERAFRELTGRTELTKTIYSRILHPYAASRLGPALLVASGASLGEERQRLRERIDRTLAGRGQGKLEGLDALVKNAVEQRALFAQRALSGALRAWLPVHVALAAIALVLFVLHVFFAFSYR
jgi:Pyruvate/2-oxoacid:ferredoxin oxidoreductase delta subunit